MIFRTRNVRTKTFTADLRIREKFERRCIIFTLFRPIESSAEEREPLYIYGRRTVHVHRFTRLLRNKINHNNCWHARQRSEQPFSELWARWRTATKSSVSWKHPGAQGTVAPLPCMATVGDTSILWWRFQFELDANVLSFYACTRFWRRHCESSLVAKLSLCLNLSSPTIFVVGGSVFFSVRRGRLVVDTKT